MKISSLKEKSISDYMFSKAIRLYAKGAVKPESLSPTYAIYRVIGDRGEYQVILDLSSDTASCTCPYYSLHPDSPCSHIVASLIHFQRNFDLVVKHAHTQARKVPPSQG